MKMFLKMLVISFIMFVFFTFYSMMSKEPVVESIKKEDIIFESNEYDTTKEVFLVDLEGGK